MKKRFILLSTTVILFFSCQNNPENTFIKMIENPIIDEGAGFSTLFSYDMKKGTYNKYQDKLYCMGKSINIFLLKKAEGVSETKYIIPNVITPLTDGDIAITLLLDINRISDDVFFSNLVHSEIKEEYKVNGASIWWKWIHKSINNRKWVIREIEKHI